MKNSYAILKQSSMLQPDEIGRIERYIKGIANNEEIEWVEGFFANGHDNQHLQQYLESDWEASDMGGNNAVELERMLDRVHHLIREKEEQKRQSFISRFARIYSKIAAILILPLLLASGFFISYLLNPKTPVVDQLVSSVIYAPMGSRVSFNLPDGTKGWLNSGSSLSYAMPFSDNRKVTLEGEAWFDVFHNETHPFEISAGESNIKVLGTSFNISAYKVEKYVEVVLLNGKVEFTDKAQSKDVIMKPSERLILHDDKLEVNTVDPTKYKAWTDGKLIFRGDNMAEVARRIERWYDVTVELADRDLDQFSFRATFKDDSLNDVLKLLSMTSPIEYKIIPRVQLPDGTYQKEKVILYKKEKPN